MALTKVKSIPMPLTRRSRTDWQVCHLEVLRVVLAGVLDTLYLLLVLEELVGQGSRPSRIAIAWAAR
eukprot:3245707-Pleurochrysis_carterae.AAC.1